MTAEESIRSLINHEGAISFSRFMQIALYEPGSGFYEIGGHAGRRGDFITSPEVGPLFGAVIANTIDTEWKRLGQPDPFFVFDVGAGPGTLAKTVLFAKPKCAPALRYVLVETSAVQRENHAQLLPLESSETIFGAIVGDDDDEVVVRGQGPLVCSVANLPAVKVDGVVVANELFDNVPFDIAEFDGATWCERMVTVVEGDLRYVSGPLNRVDTEWLKKMVPQPRPRTIVPLYGNAGALLLDLFDVLQSGKIISLDYAADTVTLATRSPEWLRTYNGHQRGYNPLINIGEQDVTADVAFDQLARVKEPHSIRTQGTFLFDNGIDPLIEEGKRIWEERAHLGDLEALRARSRVNEAAALLDPDGLGAFTVAEWVLR